VRVRVCMLLRSLVDNLTTLHAVFFGRFMFFLFHYHLCIPYFITGNEGCLMNTL
jgi:hypothetical protein